MNLPNPPLLPTLQKRREFLAHRRSPRHSGDLVILQGRLFLCGRPNSLKAGLTVTRKTGNAVERNRVKRRLRHALAKAVEEATMRLIDHNKTVDQLLGSHICGELIIIARRKVLAVNYDHLVAEITKGIDRLLTKGKKAS